MPSSVVLCVQLCSGGKIGIIKVLVSALAANTYLDPHYSEYHKSRISYIFNIIDSELKIYEMDQFLSCGWRKESEHDPCGRMNNLRGWKRTWENSGLIGNRTMTFTMAGRNALSIELIKPTGEQVIVSSLPSGRLRTYNDSFYSWLDSRSSLNSYMFFFNRLGCSFDCEDHVYFHIIHSIIHSFNKIK